MSTTPVISAANKSYLDVLDRIEKAHFVERYYAEPITDYSCNLDYCYRNPIVTFYSLGEPEAGVVLPNRATAGSIGFDIRYNSHFQEEDREDSGLIIPGGRSTIVSTGVRAFVDILCVNSYLQIMSRSGLASKGIIATGGVIDTDYTGEIKVILTNITNEDFVIHHGDKIAQLVLVEVPFLYKKDPIGEGDLCTRPLTAIAEERKEGGFGSTGK